MIGCSKENRENTLNKLLKEIKKPALKFDLRVALIGFEQLGPGLQMGKNNMLGKPEQLLTG